MPNPNWDDIAKCWQIGYGTTHYPNGNPVTQVDKSISEELATEYLMFYVNKCVDVANKYIMRVLTQNQFDAIVIFAYNVGIEALKDSTLLQVLNKDPMNSGRIYEQLMRWVYSQGKVIHGLKNRRTSEYQLYIS